MLVATRAASLCIMMCATPPPALRDAAEFSRGALGVDGGLRAWWRQDPEIVQVVVAMPEDASFKRDVALELSRKRIALSIVGTSVLDGDLSHDIVADECEWCVEDELEGFDEGRYLVVGLRKHESYVDWATPLRGDGGAAVAPERVLRIGGKGDAQRQATGQQLASYQILQKLPHAVRGDVYARVPAATDGKRSVMLYFVGKVIAESALPTLALATQSVLVREHARLYQPEVFADVDDDEKIELWLAPGNSEMRVAQNEICLERWVPPVDANLPAAGECGFEPETAPPPHMGSGPFMVRRDDEGRPVSASFQANVVKPNEVPGAVEAWIKDQ